MVKYLSLLLMLALTSCTALGWGAATPIPVREDLAIQRFLTSAPVVPRVTTTPIPDATATFLIPPGMPLPLVDPLNVVGNLTISGSPALAPLTRLLYAGFVSDGYRNTMQIEEVGSDTVFALYCTQEATNQKTIDIIMADRPIKQSELALCREHNRQPIALRVALDGIVIAMSADATFVTSVSRTELLAIFTARRWADVRLDWPKEEITRVIPTADSVNFILFVDKILGYNAPLLQNAPATTMLDEGREIAFALADAPYAVGFLDFADYQQNADGLRILPIDGVLPNRRSVSSGRYILSYPLLLYTDEETLASKAQVGAFLLYYLTNMNDVMGEVGNFPVNEAIYERTKAILLTAMRQEAYLAQFPPTSTPAPPPTPTMALTPTATMIPMATLTATLTTTLTGR